MIYECDRLTHLSVRGVSDVCNIFFPEYFIILTKNFSVSTKHKETLISVYSPTFCLQNDRKQCSMRFTLIELQQFEQKHEKLSGSWVLTIHGTPTFHSLAHHSYCSTHIYIVYLSTCPPFQYPFQTELSLDNHITDTINTRFNQNFGR